jgi:HPt (histidine-containing phosphotransfer) domain-containing protein
MPGAERLKGKAMNKQTAGNDSQIMDLEMLKARCLGNLDLVDRVLKKFATQLDSDLVELEQALDAGDTRTLASVAHRIKGMSANVEAWPLHGTAVAAERSARENQLAQLPDQLDRLRQERARLTESLPELLVQVSGQSAVAAKLDGGEPCAC